MVQNWQLRSGFASCGWSLTDAAFNNGSVSATFAFESEAADGAEEPARGGRSEAAAAATRMYGLGVGGAGLPGTTVCGALMS